MAITIDKKSPAGFNFISIAALVGASIAVGYFYFDSVKAVKARDSYVRQVQKLEGEKEQISKDFSDLKTQLDAQQSKMEALAKEAMAAKSTQQIAENELKRKSEEVRKLQEQYEKRIIELEQDVKRYADFGAVLAKALEPIQKAIGGGSRFSLAEEPMRNLGSSDKEKLPGTVTENQKSFDLTAGQILSVNRQYGFIITNLGALRGAIPGSNLQIYRHNEALGMAQVEKVEDQFSAASIVSEDLSSRVENGDRVVLVS